MTRTHSSVIAATLIAVTHPFTACGGKVNVGSDRHDTPAPGDDGSRPEAGSSGRDSSNGSIGPAPVTILPLPSRLSLTDLTIWDGTLYAIGREYSNDRNGIYRLSTSAPGRGFERVVLAPSASRIVSLQASGGRLGVALDARYGEERSLATCVLPKCAELLPTIEGLPIQGTRPQPSFHQSDVYFFIYYDVSLYHCSLPGCEGGPRALWSGDGTVRSVQATDEMLFWHVGAELFWALDRGRAAPERLRPGSTLQPMDPHRDLEPGTPEVSEFAVGDDELYAIVDDDPDEDTVLKRLVRWPLRREGAREVISEDIDGYYGFAAFSNEVAWVDREGSLFTCHVAACAETRRAIGYMKPGGALPLVADEQNLYWLDASPDAHSSVGTEPPYVRLRAVARLQ